jgi:hypothetical protein
MVSFTYLYSRERNLKYLRAVDTRLGPTAGLNAVVKTKICTLVKNRNPVFELSANLLW